MMQEMPAPTDATVPTFYASFCEAAQRCSSHIALREVSTQRAISYAELKARVDVVAASLANVARGSVVGTFMHRSISFEVAKLACSKVGLVALPLPPDYPVQRLEHIIAAASPAMILVDSASKVDSTWLATVLSTPMALDMSDIQAEGSSVIESCFTASCEGSQTSGVLLSSSGTSRTPKLILRRDASFYHRLRWTWATLPFTADEACLQKSHMTTTHHMYEVLEPLLQGITVHILPDISSFGVHNLLPFVRDAGISRLLLVPTLLRALLDTPWDTAGVPPSQIKVVVMMGEDPPKDVCMRAIEMMPSTRIFSIYGSTEASSSLVLEINGELCRTECKLPLGNPICSDVRVHVLRSDMSDAAPDEVGALYFSGPHLMAAYIGADAEGSKALAPHPSTGELLYDTHDAASRALASQALSYHGRTDAVVKLRGYRVQLEEVDMELRQLSGITTAAAVVVGFDAPQLIGFVAPLSALLASGDLAATLQQMRETLAEQLPHYMVPRRLFPLPSLPLTQSGKTDRRALESIGGLMLQEGHGASTPTHGLSDDKGPRRSVRSDSGESVVQEILLDVVGVHALPGDRIGNVGVDSLNLKQVIEKLRPYSDSQILGSTLLQNPTVAELGAFLDCTGTASESGSKWSVNIEPTYGLRTLVCLWIVRNHTDSMCPGSLEDMSWVDTDNATWRVTIFILLATMSASMKYDKAESRVSVRTILLHNVAPLFPVAWICLLMVIPIGFAPCADQAPAVVGLVFNACLLYGWFPIYPLTLEQWFLSAMIVFYLLFNRLQHAVQAWLPVSTLSRFLRSLLILQLCTLVVRGLCFFPTGSGYITHFWSIPHIPQFMIGLVVGQAAIHLPLRDAQCRVVARFTDAIAFLLLLSVFTLPGWTGFVQYCAMDAVIGFIIFGICRSPSVLARMLSCGVLKDFAPYTLGVYIVHMPVIKWTRFVGAHNLTGVGDFFTFKYADTPCDFQWGDDAGPGGTNLGGLLPGHCWNGQCTNGYHPECSIQPFGHVHIVLASLLLGTLLTVLVHHPCQRVLNRLATGGPKGALKVW